jgi:hypothetical protein
MALVPAPNSTSTVTAQAWVSRPLGRARAGEAALFAAPPLGVPVFDIFVWEKWSRKCGVQLFGHGVTERLGRLDDVFLFLQIFGILVSAGMQRGCEIVDSLRGEGVFDGQDAGSNYSSFRAGFGLGDIQMLGRQRR